MDGYKEYAEELGILALMQLSQEQLDFAWKHTKKHSVQSLKIGEKEIRLNYIPAPGKEDKYFAVDKETQFFVVIDGNGNGIVQMDPPKQSFAIKEYQEMSGFNSEGKDRVEEEKRMKKEQEEKAIAEKERMMKAAQERKDKEAADKLAAE